MTSRNGMHSTGLAALALCVALGACSKGENAATDTAAARTDTNTAAGAVSAATAPNSTAAANSSAGNNMGGNAMSDANIFALLDAASTGEISEGKMAESKATNPAVKEFARKMVADHTKLKSEGSALAKKLNITPALPSDTGFIKDDHDKAKDLMSKKVGKDWDEDYIEAQIDDHKTVLDKIDDAMKATQNSDIKAMLTKARADVDAHLKLAQDIKDNRLKS
jgi:putative membrane protein